MDARKFKYILFEGSCCAKTHGFLSVGFRTGLVCNHSFKAAQGENWDPIALAQARELAQQRRQQPVGDGNSQEGRQCFFVGSHIFYRSHDKHSGVLLCGLCPIYFAGRTKVIVAGTSASQLYNRQNCYRGGTVLLSETPCGRGSATIAEVPGTGLSSLSELQSTRALLREIISTTLCQPWRLTVGTYIHMLRAGNVECSSCPNKEELTQGPKHPGERHMLRCATEK